LARADARLAVSADCWDCDPWLLNCPGGTVDLRTGEMRAHRRDDLITKLCPVSPGDGGCPLWETFLARATDGKSELQSYLQRMAGYCATGSTREQSLFFLYGTGGNGKGVFINTITAVLEPYCAVAPIEMLLDSRNSADRHPTDLAGLRGKRLVTAVEVGKGRRWQEEKLKNLTGGDRVTARFMRGDFFEFAPVFKLLIAANHRPSLRSVDEAIRRRLHLVPFVVTIPESERDHDLGEKLKAEWPGILRWIIEGCLAWQREGLNPPAVARRATAEYFGEEDTVGRWIEEHCILGIQHDASGKALFADWKLWAEAAGEYAGSQKGFGQNLEAREGIARFRTGSERKYLGIRLRTLEDADVEIASSQPDVESEDFSA
jgi:putative DNA primase/helicase